MTLGNFEVVFYTLAYTLAFIVPGFVGYSVLSALVPVRAVSRHSLNGLLRLFDFPAALVESEFLVQPGNHLADAGPGQPLGRQRVLLLEPIQPGLQVLELLLGLPVLLGARDHSSISTSPLRRPSASRVRLTPPGRRRIFASRQESRRRW